MTDRLPPYVRKKTAKGLTYYYFASGKRLVRLPDLTDPLFHQSYDRLIRSCTSRRRRTDDTSRRSLPPQVYFIGTDTGPIKIGMSCDPDGRCREMRVGSPGDLRVLATAPGGRALEKRYHARFGYARIRGEWFDRHPDLLAEIDRLRA